MRLALGPRAVARRAACATLVLDLLGPAAIRAQSPHPLLASIPEGTVVELGPYTCASPAGEDPDACDKITDYSGMVYDGARHRLLMFGGGHATVFTDTISAFDFDTLSWRDLYQPTDCASMSAGNLDLDRGAWLRGPSGPYPRPYSTHTYDLLGVVGNEFIMASSGSGRGGCAPTVASPSGGDGYIASGRVAHYDLVAGTWRFTPVERFFLPSMELDPTSGHMLLVGRDLGLALYDPVLGTLDESVPDAGEGDMGLDGGLVYFPPTDRFYYFGARDSSPTVGVWEVVLDRASPSRSTVTRLSPDGTPPSNRRGWAYDSASEVIGGGISAGEFFAFDPVRGAWLAERMTAASGAVPSEPAFQALAYDPIDNVYVFLAGPAFDKRTYAYRYRGGVPARPDGGLTGGDGGTPSVLPDGGGSSSSDGGGPRLDGSPRSARDGASEADDRVAGGCSCIAWSGGHRPGRESSTLAVLALLLRAARGGRRGSAPRGCRRSPSR